MVSSMYAGLIDVIFLGEDRERGTIQAAHLSDPSQSGVFRRLQLYCGTTLRPPEIQQP